MNSLDKMEDYDRLSNLCEKQAADLTDLQLELRQAQYGAKCEAEYANQLRAENIKLRKLESKVTDTYGLYPGTVEVFAQPKEQL